MKNNIRFILLLCFISLAIQSCEKIDSNISPPEISNIRLKSSGKAIPDTLFIGMQDTIIANLVDQDGLIGCALKLQPLFGDSLINDSIGLIFSRRGKDITGKKDTTGQVGFRLDPTYMYTKKGESMPQSYPVKTGKYNLKFLAADKLGNQDSIEFKVTIAYPTSIEE